MPVTKTVLYYDDESEETYDVDKHKRHTLFAGTSVIQTRCYGQYNLRSIYKNDIIIYNMCHVTGFSLFV